MPDGKEALEHLQNAVLEIIAATRAALDVAEELIKDPSPLLAAAQKVSQPAPPPAEGAAPRVEHINVQ